MLKQIADFGFLTVSLIRLRRTVILASSIPAINNEMQIALKTFDAAVPRLATLRNVAEHFDDYVLERGRDKSLTAEEFHSGLQVATWSNDEFNWLDAVVHFDDCLSAAEELFFALRNARQDRSVV